MMRTLKHGDQIGSSRLREDASQAKGRQAGPRNHYCGEMFAACIPFGPRLVS
jgi:hypothetical protein